MNAPPKPGEKYRLGDHFFIVEDVDEHQSVRVWRVQAAGFANRDCWNFTLGSDVWQRFLCRGAVRVEDQ